MNTNKSNKLEIYIEEDSIILKNRNRNCLIQYRRNMIAEYLDVNSSKLKLKNPLERNAPSDELVTNSGQMLAKVNNEIVDIDFKDFQNWIVAEKSHRYFITDNRFDVTQENDLQEIHNLNHPSYISNLQSALTKALTYLETPKLLSFAHWVTSSNNKADMDSAEITSILLGELSNRRQISQNKPENVTKLELVSK
jgi:hypothetical protein